MESPQPNFRSTAYYAAQRSIDCRLCGGSTRIVALGLPANHEVLDEDAELDAAWQPVAANALLFFLEQLPLAAEQQLRLLAPGFRRTPSEAAQHGFWANHCERCDATLDDQELHCEPGDSFVPSSEAEGSKIRVIRIEEPIEVSAQGCSLDPAFLPFGRSS